MDLVFTNVIMDPAVIRRTTVTIIGAGAAGLKAAVDLKKAGVNFVLLEARNRIGGRVKTYRDDGGRVFDLGASWFHDSISNELFFEAIKNDISVYYDDGETMYFDHTGQPVTKQMKTERVVYDCTCSIGEKYQDLSAPDISLKQTVEHFAETYPLVSDVNKKLAPQMMRQLELWHGIRWDIISSKYGLTEETGRDAFVTSGYDKVINMVCGPYNPDQDLNLVTNAEVLNISKVPKEGLPSSSYKKDIKITTKDNKTYLSDYVICTIPIAVMQKRQDSLLDSTLQLSKEVDSIIKEAEIAFLGKIFLEFESVFWPKDVDRFIVLGNESLRTGDSNKPQPNTCPIFFANGFCSLGEPTLIALTAPPLTQFLEKNTNLIEDYLMEPLKALRVDKSAPVPRIKKVIMTDWSLDPFALGTYSAIRVGQDYYGSVIPFQQGSNNFRFAGEHTASEGNGCVHGAVRSGQREASYIIEQLGI